MTIKNNQSSTGNEGQGTPGGSNEGGSSGAAGDEGNGDGQTSGDEGKNNEETLDDSKLDERTKAYIAKLRKENAKHRTAAKTNENLLNDTRARLSKIAGGGQEENEPADVQIEKLSSHIGALEFDRALLEIAVDRGIDKGGMNYFRFLVADATAKLGDGEELTDEALETITKEVQSKTKTRSSSSVGTGNEGKGTPPAPGGNSDMTVEKFARMTVVEKSELFLKNRPVYDAMFAEAKEKKRLV